MARLGILGRALVLLLLVARVCEGSRIFGGRKLSGWTCSCKVCGTYQITPWDKNCKCCYERPPETPSCLSFICSPTAYLYFSNSCHNPLNLRYTDTRGVTHTDVFTVARGDPLRTSNGVMVQVDPSYPIGWKWAGEPVEWRKTNFKVKRYPCTGERCDNCCNVQQGFTASFSC